MRKSLKKMLKMKVELEEIEKKVNNEETVKMMKKEQKEKIRIGETIMNLLLRLDSVSVFHCCYALRDLRKLLIKRAIVLQEFVDQIQMIRTEVEDENGDGKCDGVEEICLEKKHFQRSQLLLSHGESSTLFQQSSKNRIRCYKAARATAITFIRTRFCN